MSKFIRLGDEKLVDADRIVGVEVYQDISRNFHVRVLLDTHSEENAWLLPMRTRRAARSYVGGLLYKLTSDQSDIDRVKDELLAISEETA